MIRDIKIRMYVISITPGTLVDVEDNIGNAIISMGTEESLKFEIFARDMKERNFDVKFYSYDLTEDKCVVSLSVSTPVFLVYKDSEIVDHVVGFNKEALFAAMHNHFVDSEPVDNQWVLKTLATEMKFESPEETSDLSVDVIDDVEEEVLVGLKDGDFSDCDHGDECCCINMNLLDL